MAKEKSPWCSATFPPHPPPSAPSRDSLYQAISLYLRVRSMRSRGRQCAPSLCLPIPLTVPPLTWLPGLQMGFPRDRISFSTRHRPSLCPSLHTTAPEEKTEATLQLRPWLRAPEYLAPGTVHRPCPCWSYTGTPSPAGALPLLRRGDCTSSAALSSSGLSLQAPSHRTTSESLVPLTHLLVNFQMSTHPWPLF